jgi:hypothetical protein
MVQAFKEIGLFGNQNTVCKPTAQKWRSTVERLKERFPNFAQAYRIMRHVLATGADDLSPS